MMMIKRAGQIGEERKRLQRREEELKQMINSSWSELTGVLQVKLPVDKTTAIETSKAGDSILVSTLAYAGALLGRKVGIQIEQKINDFLCEEE